MARRRMIDPSLWQDWDFGRLSVGARILFIACVSNADDDGYLLGNPMFLKSIAFLYDKTTAGRIQKHRDEIVAVIKNIHYFKIGNDEYLHLLKWEEYQYQKPDRRIASKYPQCPRCVGHDGDIVATSGRHSAAEVRLSSSSKKSVGEESVKEGDLPPRGGGRGLDSVRKLADTLRPHGTGAHSGPTTPGSRRTL